MLTKSEIITLTLTILQCFGTKHDIAIFWVTVMLLVGGVQCGNSRIAGGQNAFKGMPKYAFCISHSVL